MHEVEKMRAKWFRGCMVVSRFLCLPIRMNYAENKKWRTSPPWRGRGSKVLGGYTRGGQWVRKGPAPPSQKTNRTGSCKLPLGTSLNRLAGVCLAGEEDIVAATPAKPPRRCPGGPWRREASSRRRRMGSVGCWPLATPTNELTGGNLSARTPQWLKRCAESSSGGS
jgi:hypothetical protein